MTDSIKIYLLLLIGFLLITCPIIIINYIHDPYAIFTKVVDKNTLISKNYRYSFPNIAKKMFFKTAIIGTSDSLPYHQKNTNYFDTILISIANVSMENIIAISEKHHINFNIIKDDLL